MKLFENPFGIHEQAVAVRNKRMELIGKYSNADTPHFKHVIWILEDLGCIDPAPMAATNARHFGTSEREPERSRLSRALQLVVDGNTVEIAVEQAQYQAAADYQATLRFLEAVFRDSEVVTW